MREVGIKQAKINLSKLVLEARNGNPVFLTNHGKRIAKIVPVGEAEPTGTTQLRGLGWLDAKGKYPKGWDTQTARRKASQQVIALMNISK